MADLLLELFSEEIPSGMQARGAQDLQRLVCDGLKDAGLDFKNVKNFAGPRRLTLVVEGLPDKSADVSEERKGPRVGAPDKAVEGFLRGAGLESIDQAEIVSDSNKGDFYVAKIEKPGRATDDIVAEVVPAVIRTFPWPKSMRWGDKTGSAWGSAWGSSWGTAWGGPLRWVRPLHSILCLLDGKVVPFEIVGIVSGNETQGHRFMAPDAFAVKDFADYEKKLREAHVILDAEERRKLILDGAKAAAKHAGLDLVEDEALLAENAGLVEWPVVLMGEFDKEFLDVPPEVIVTAIKKHQKCFSLRDTSSSSPSDPSSPSPLTGEGRGGGEGGKPGDAPPTPNPSPPGGGASLASNFVLVSNLIAQDGGKAIIEGNERVVRARLSDAKFFWDQDRKVKLGDRLPELEDIIFHEKLGTQADRVERLKALARELAPVAGADPDKAERAAELSKADLVTGMVGEFPDLQGLMGKYYALDQGEDASVAAAIEEHYRPLGPNDAVPTDPVSITVALADKLDTLVGFWAIDEKPTGSKDPYALRRAALGAIRLVLENDLRLQLRSCFELHYANWLLHYTNAFNLFTYDGSEPTNQLILTYIDPLHSPAKRETHYFVLFEPPRNLNLGDDEIAMLGHDDSPVRIPNLEILPVDLLAFFHDRLKVYLRDRGARHDLIDAVISPQADDLFMIVARVEALGKFLETDDGANLLIGVKRAINILRIEEKKDGKAYGGAPDAKLLKEKEEKALAKAIGETAKAAGAAVEKEDFEGAMRAIAKLRGPVDGFFDNVTVNADDPGLRENRLKLLNRIREATLAVADFSRIEG